jgi:hypothetical protein
LEVCHARVLVNWSVKEGKRREESTSLHT